MTTTPALATSMKHCDHNTCPGYANDTLRPQHLPWLRQWHTATTTPDLNTPITQCARVQQLPMLFNMNSLRFIICTSHAHHRTLLNLFHCILQPAVNYLPNSLISLLIFPMIFVVVEREWFTILVTKPTAYNMKTCNRSFILLKH